MTANVADEAPSGTTTVAGTTTMASLLDSATVSPPDGAALSKVTVPTEVSPD
ncbi:MAG TPA: hypothetical protein VGP07_26325 [Polyangia bacterium]